MTTVPDCPDCETDVFVGRAKAPGRKWTCHYCGRRFEAVVGR